jgi:4-azaleucine resistance transporter AzlC
LSCICQFVSLENILAGKIAYIMRISLTSTPLQQFSAGLKAEAPLFFGVFPFGMIYGALAIKAGLTAGIAQAMSAVVFGGASQFIAIQLIGSAAPTAVIILAIAVVNLRHALYSASLSPYLNNLSIFWKIILAYLLTDEAYAVTITHFIKDIPENNRHWFFLGAGFGLWLTWQTGTAAGIILGAIIPTSWSLDFTLSLTFIALVLPNLKDRPSLAAALTAGLTAVLTYSLPYSLWIIAAALAGVCAGLWVEAKERAKEWAKE